MSAVYETHLASGTAFPGAEVGIAWMDTRLLRAALYSGSTIPGGGPYANHAPIDASAARTLVAAFNAGFLMGNTNGGYYTDGRVVAPLRLGAASAVIYKSGLITVGMWGRDVRMTRAVAAVRQNLNLLVDHGRPVPGLNPNDTVVWGYTLGNQVHVWRSGLGVTADGAVVYVAGADLDITELAKLLVRAGSVRAMELDINTDAVNLATYRPASPTGIASPSDGTDLVASMFGSPARYFYPWWSRDFFTMSARTLRGGAATTG
ncbi:MAG: phosphodiester glycosidase family protein [Actinomycetota bacterium]|nr:phosphodiester glycosidase family protein [Actinomycetota bacterium]